MKTNREKAEEKLRAAAKARLGFEWEPNLEAVDVVEVLLYNRDIYRLALAFATGLEVSDTDACTPEEWLEYAFATIRHGRAPVWLEAEQNDADDSGLPEPR